MKKQQLKNMKVYRMMSEDEIIVIKSDIFGEGNEEFFFRGVVFIFIFIFLFSFGRHFVYSLLLTLLTYYFYSLIFICKISVYKNYFKIEYPWRFAFREFQYLPSDVLSFEICNNNRAIRSKEWIEVRFVHDGIEKSKLHSIEPFSLNNLKMLEITISKLNIDTYFCE